MTYDINTITFLDIETIPRHPWSELEPEMQMMFLQKFKKQIEEIYAYGAQPLFFLEDFFICPKCKQDGEGDRIQPCGACNGMGDNYKFKEFYNQKASLLAEFNTVVSVALGAIVDTTKDNPKGRLFVRTFVGDEKTILEGVAASLGKRKPSYVCAHNGLGFDFPVLERKYMMYGMQIPAVLDNRGKKPWDSPWIDTQTIWACGEYKYFVALALLCHLFGLKAPKEDMSGAEVYTEFKKGNIQRIRTYNAGDVVSLANVFLRMQNMAVYEENEIEIK